jgi:hypothetical protein
MPINPRDDKRLDPPPGFHGMAPPMRGDTSGWDVSRGNINGWDVPRAAVPTGYDMLPNEIKRKVPKKKKFSTDEGAGLGPQRKAY